MRVKNFVHNSDENFSADDSLSIALSNVIDSDIMKKVIKTNNKRDCRHISKLSVSNYMRALDFVFKPDVSHIHELSETLCKEFSSEPSCLTKRKHKSRF